MLFSITGCAIAAEGKHNESQPMKSAIFPIMSADAARKDFVSLQKIISRGIRGTVFVALPATIGLILVARPLISAGYAHGVGISKPGCKNEKEREAAGLFIAWMTSKDQEVKRLEEGFYNSYARVSTLQHPLFQQKVKPEIREAIVEMDPFTELPIWPIPEWPEIGDRLGVILEELFTGSRTDIQDALYEANEYAKEVLARRR